MQTNIPKHNHEPKFLITYKSNIDREATYEKLLPIFWSMNNKKKPEFSINWDEKGHLKIVFWSTRFLISPSGIIQVAFSNPEEKKEAWNIFLCYVALGHIVANKNHNFEYEPIRQTVTIPFPAPRDFKIVWCGLEQTFKNWSLLLEKWKIMGLAWTVIMLGAVLIAYLLTILR